MNRRQFISRSGVAALAVGKASMALTPAPEEPVTKPVLMKLGCQSAPTNDEHLKYLARYGVRNICGYPELADGRGNVPNWATVDELSRMKDLATKNGIEIDCVGPPVLTSSYIDNERHPAIMLAQSPERDRDIEAIQTLIRNCSRAGLPSIKYNMSILGVLRSGTQLGRGDERDAVWQLSDAQAKLRAAQPSGEVIVGGHDDTTGRAMPISSASTPKAAPGL